MSFNSRLMRASSYLFISSKVSEQQYREKSLQAETKVAVTTLLLSTTFLDARMGYGKHMQINASKLPPKAFTISFVAEPARSIAKPFAKFLGPCGFMKAIKYHTKLEMAKIEKLSGTLSQSIIQVKMPK